MGKPGFVNYVSDRLNGFGGQAAPWTIDDLADAPELFISQYGGEAGAHIMPANCEGASATRAGAAAARPRQLHAPRSTARREAFMPAVSPG